MFKWLVICVVQEGLDNNLLKFLFYINQRISPCVGFTQYYFPHSHNIYRVNEALNRPTHTLMLRRLRIEFFVFGLRRFCRGASFCTSPCRTTRLSYPFSTNTATRRYRDVPIDHHCTTNQFSLTSLAHYSSAAPRKNPAVLKIKGARKKSGGEFHKKRN